MNIHRLFAVLLPPFRRRRMARFVRTFPLTEESRILDVGGTAANWTLVASPSQITLLNLREPAEPDALPANLHHETGDGRALPYPDSSFDVVFSNSVIEHVGDYESQARFASEALRVGRAVWVETPLGASPFEPHLLTPIIHWLPRSWQRRLIRNFTLWGWLTRPSQAYVDGLVDELRLITHDEMRELFPGCEIRRERFLGLTKAYLAVRGA